MPRPRGQERRLDQRWFREALPTRHAQRTTPKARRLSGPIGATGAEDRPEPRPAPPPGAKHAEAFLKSLCSLTGDFTSRRIDPKK